MRDVTHSYDSKVVAVTGASGYIASALIDALKETSARILRVSRRDLPPVSGQENLKADIRSKDCWDGIVARADVIFHLAGSTSLYTAARDPADSLNSTVLPIIHLVTAAQVAGRRPRVVFASTATVYGLTGKCPVAEDAPAAPITNYDLHKLFGERQLQLASNQGILEGVSLRLANVYGASSSTSSADDRGVLNRIAALAMRGNSLSLYGDGNYLRDYVYIDDVAKAFLAAGVEKGLTGRSYNVASGSGITVREAFHLVAQRVESATGRQVHIENAAWPEGADPIEFRNFVADVGAFEKSTGWCPIVDLDQGIDRMIAYFGKNMRGGASA